jgi:hypothetical protein
MKTNSITIKQLTDWILVTLRESAWAPLSVYGFYVFGLMIDLFDRYPYLDMPVHFMGGVVITYFYRSAIHNSQKILGEIPLPIQVLFAFTCTGTTTVLWEFYENFADRFLNTQMVRGLEDTIVDLLVGVAGALLLSVFYRRR